MVCSIEILERMMGSQRPVVLLPEIIGEFVAMAGNRGVSYVSRFTNKPPIAGLMKGVRR